MNKLSSIFCITFGLLVAYSYGAANDLLNQNLLKYKKHPITIVNGTDAEDGEFPYMVQVRSYGSFLCGGTIIGDKWILTAGHCVKALYSITDIVYGTNILYEKEDTSTTVQVKYLHLHPKFYYYEDQSHTIPYYDVGILELEEPLPLNSSNVTVGVVQLADSDEEEPIHVSGILTGWGVNTTFSTSAAQKLQKIELQLLSIAECTDRVNAYSSTEIYNGTLNICSDDHDNGQCYGDSGSPFIINGIQYGIVSWSLKPCGIVPGTYSRITNPEYREFIRNVTGI